jgi:hypothetical protein
MGGDVNFNPSFYWPFVKLGATDVWRHKTRSFLTMLGMVFGVGSVIAMLAVGEGASQQALESIKRLGSQNILVSSVKPVSDAANATTVSVTGAQPGFYYSVVYSADLSTLDASGVEGDRAVAGADGSVTLPIPAKTENATAGFYRVKVSVQAAD